MKKMSDKALEAAQEKAGMHQITVFEFVFWCGVIPMGIAQALYLAGKLSSEAEALRVGKVIVIATVILNLFLIIKGEYRIVLKRSKPGKTAADTVKKGVVRTAGKAAQTAGKAAVAKTAADIAREAAKTVAGNSGGKIKWSESDPDWMTVKDPATGAESGYKLNTETGEWVNAETGSVLDTGDIGRWQNEREKEREWIDKQNEKIRNRDTAFDDKLNDMRKQAEEEARKIDEESKHVLEIWNKYHTLDDRPEHIKEILEREQRLNQIEADRSNRIGNLNAVLESGLEWTVKLADWGMDILGEMTGPAGKHGIKNLYIIGKNFGYRLKEAEVYGKDMDSAKRHALADTLVDVVQSETSNMGWGYKLAANSGGDGVKAMMQAIDDGEDPVEALMVGTFGGGLRTGGEYFISKGTNKFKMSFLNGKAKQLHSVSQQYMSGNMKQSVYKATSGIIQTQMKEGAQLIEKGAGTFVNDVAGDITKAVNDKMFNTHSKMQW